MNKPLPPLPTERLLERNTFNIQVSVSKKKLAMSDKAENALSYSSLKHLHLYIDQLLHFAYLNGQRSYLDVIFSLVLKIAKDTSYPSSIQLHIFMSDLTGSEDCSCDYVTGVTQGVKLFDTEDLVATPSTIYFKAPKKDHNQLLNIIRMAVFAGIHLRLESQVFRDFLIPSQQLDTEKGSIAAKGNADPEDAKKSTKESKSIKSAVTRFLSRSHSNHDDNSPLSLSDITQSMDSRTRFRRQVHEIKSILLSISAECTYPLPFVYEKLCAEEKRAFDSSTALWDDDDNNAFTDSNSISLFSSKTGKVSLATKLSLNNLISSNNSIRGIYQHQRIRVSHEVFFEKAATHGTNPSTNRHLCSSNKSFVMDFYRKFGGNEDFTIASFLQALYWKCTGETPEKQHDDENPPLHHLSFILNGKSKVPICSHKHCGNPMLDHIYSFTHGSRRINFRVEKAKKNSLLAVNNQEVYSKDHLSIVSWGTCAICGQSTPRIYLTDMSKAYSFAKYLENLFYTDNFALTKKGDQGSLCTHTDSILNTLRFFQIGDVIFRVDCSESQLYSIQVPRIQCEGDVQGRTSFESVTESTDLRRTLDSTGLEFPYTQSTKLQMKDAVRLDVTKFFMSVKEVITHFEELTGYMNYIHLAPSHEKDSLDQAERKQGSLLHTLKSIKRSLKSTSIKLSCSPGRRNHRQESERNGASETLGPTCELPSAPVAHSTLEALTKNLLVREHVLYDALKSSPSNILNEFRTGPFGDEITFAVRTLCEWSATFLVQHISWNSSRLQDENFQEWNLKEVVRRLQIPAYIHFDYLHFQRSEEIASLCVAPPGSSILVHNQEPSSLLAFALR
jgi:hypothetical protein